MAGTDYNSSTNKFIGGGTYYFISEYVIYFLPGIYYIGIAYQGETLNGMNLDGNNASDYAASNLRAYINGMTVRSYATFINNDTYNDGFSGNFIYQYKIVEDQLYGKIVGRNLQELYQTGANNNINSLPSKYANEVDKFWAISTSEYNLITNSGKNKQKAIGCDLSFGSYNMANNCWFLRTPQNNANVVTINNEGNTSSITYYEYEVMVRPSFALVI